MKRITIKAVYEAGVLKPEAPLPLAENERVAVTVHIGPSFAERAYGLMKWTGSLEDLEYLAESADLDCPDIDCGG
jgi:predicted DNA-binding antitoxin AbrB/MazE fold protein